MPVSAADAADPARRPNAYSGSPLDRAGTRREDAAWIAARLADPDSLFVPVWRSRKLVRGHGRRAGRKRCT